MKKYVCLRDDDTNYYTRVDEIESAYGDLLGSIPITLATVPFEHGSEWIIIDLENETAKSGVELFHELDKWEKNASVSALNDYYSVHPIGKNAELVNFLIEYVSRDMIEIAEHGVMHRYDVQGAEMECGRVIFSEIKQGKEYLEKVFKTKVETFIPPSNHIDIRCARYVASCGMNLFSSSSLIMKPYEKVFNYIRYPKSSFQKIKQNLNSTPTPLVYRAGINRIGSFTFDYFKDERRLLESINQSLKETGYAAIGSHYRAFQKEGYKDKYMWLIDCLMKDNDVTFVTAKDYYKRIVGSENE